MSVVASISIATPEALKVFLPGGSDSISDWCGWKANLAHWKKGRDTVGAGGPEKPDKSGQSRGHVAAIEVAEDSSGGNVDLESWFVHRDAKEPTGSKRRLWNVIGCCRSVFLSGSGNEMSKGFKLRRCFRNGCAGVPLHKH